MLNPLVKMANQEQDSLRLVSGSARAAEFDYWGQWKWKIERIPVVAVTCRCGA